MMSAKPSSGSEKSAPVRFALDTNVVIALVSEWDEHHAESVAGYEQRLSKGQIPLIPVSVLIESFSVLTRLPQPVRIDAETALTVLHEWFGSTEIAGMDG